MRALLQVSDLIFQIGDLAIFRDILSTLEQGKKARYSRRIRLGKIGDRPVLAIMGLLLAKTAI